MSARQSLALLLLTALPLSALPAQEKVPVAYPERDALTPFRNPTEVYAPPDRLYSLLRRMRGMANDSKYEKLTDTRGREIVKHPSWRRFFDEVQSTGLDAGYLASIMRMSKNGDDRRTAFYAMFYCDRIDDIFNLISHIPGEPNHATRQAAFPRAVEYLRVHLNKRFGDLDDEQKKAVVAALPEPGSPAAKSAGITRLPRDGDHLHELRLIPFIQLMNAKQTIDQAQALWFLKEVFAIRIDLAKRWFEPALPRLRQMLTSESATVREQVIEMLRVLGPDDLEDPPEGAAELRNWAEHAIKHTFPPIRNLNNALIQLFPSEERVAIANAAVEALENKSIGDPYVGRDKKTGQYIRGFRVAHVPSRLGVLAIPEGAIITSVNGVAVRDAETLLTTTRNLIKTLAHPRKLTVEYVHGGQTHAVEYMLM